MKVFSIVWVACAIGFIPACSDEHAHDHGEESPGADACEHLEDGPIVALAASVEPATAPAAANLHTRYDVTLTDMGGVPGGFVTIPVAEAGDHLIFINAGTTVSLVDPAGEDVTPEIEGVSTPDCAEVGKWVQYDLVVGTYTLELSGPTGATMVSLVRLEAGAEHTHE